MDKVADLDERRWYVEKTAENGWPRNVLVHQIESGLYQRQVLANKVSNFEHRLPSPQSELAEQALLFWVTSVQARICRAVEFLSVGSGWYFEENTG